MKDAGVADVLDAFTRYSAAFDEISDEDGTHYAAGAFVRWLEARSNGPGAARRRVMRPLAASGEPRPAA